MRKTTISVKLKKIAFFQSQFLLSLSFLNKTLKFQIFLLIIIFFSDIVKGKRADHKNDIICLTETWFLITTTIQFSNYKIYRADRFVINSRNYGIAILIKKYIPSKLCTSFNPYINGCLENISCNFYKKK